MFLKQDKQEGQALIEAAILLPLLLLLFLGTWHFGLRMINQSRCAMAARYAYWCGTHDHYSDMNELVITNFFPHSNTNGPYEVLISKKTIGPDSGIAAVTTLLTFLAGDAAKKNVEVTLQYRQKAIPIAAPVFDSTTSFIWYGWTTNCPITVAGVDRSTWMNVNDLVKSSLARAWPF